MKNWPNLPWPFSKPYARSQTELSFKASGFSATGNVRLKNEDDFVCDASPPIIMVADGIGSRQNGALASYLAIHHSTEILKLSWQAGEWTWPELWGAIPPKFNPSEVHEAILSHAFCHAHYHLREVINRSAQIEKAATTLTAGIFHGTQLVWAHIGHSRIYHLRGNQLRCLTTDDTRAMAALRQGDITLDEYWTHPGQRHLTKTLGGSSPYPPAFGRCDCEPGDMLLFCTNGLHDHVTEEAIRLALLEKPKEPDRKAKLLVGLAEASGGKDNTTAVVVQVS